MNIHHAFLLDVRRTPKKLRPGGLKTRQLMSVDANEILRSPWLLDWMIPSCDRPNRMSRLPPLSEEVFRKMCADEQVVQTLQKFYFRLLFLMGLTADHHGWIFKDENPSSVQVTLRELVFERTETSKKLLKLLEAINWKGYSRTDPDSSEYWYKDGLAEYIERNRGCRPAA